MSRAGIPHSQRSGAPRRPPITASVSQSVVRPCIPHIPVQIAPFKRRCRFTRAVSCSEWHQLRGQAVNRLIGVSKCLWSVDNLGTKGDGLWRDNGNKSETKRSNAKGSVSGNYRCENQSGSIEHICYNGIRPQNTKFSQRLACKCPLRT